MVNKFVLADTLLSDLAFQVRWHFSTQRAEIKSLSPMVSGPIELDMQEETEIPSFLSGYSGTDLFDVDFVEAQLTMGQTVKIVDYFSKGRSAFSWQGVFGELGCNDGEDREGRVDVLMGEIVLAVGKAILISGVSTLANKIIEEFE
ncbi:hypothetical protein [Weissella cibaria]|uniref:hypothetical protein n=1 Tax=Weissella cibaria TaxID=137591 RepID=UPI0002192AB7|nr:hypothetical protein [Weissella cibaria]APS27371.1 hypothetical protein AUC63_01362 [Weissella cibaria]APU62768.1 hypothetical protein AUC65_00967 [Weissella cibaria]APU64920.1 hypothetical protein AUC62_00961 [Weissella cibaria]ASS51705.1 hypothetical protein CHR48_00724 [Weissella cibaria]MBA5963190.1 hypothetical protein [Weissella cibaria]